MILPEDKWFYFTSGRRASSIEELKAILESMSEAEFRHHVNNERNDFANWVEGVFAEFKLAKNLREVSERDGMIIILEDFLAEKHRPLPPIIEHHAAHPEEHPRPMRKVIIPEEKKLSLEPEKELSEKEIKALVDEAVNIFAKEKKIHEKEARREDAFEERYTEKYARPEPEKPRHYDEHHRFIVREFIYGFTIGLIFGLIMLGMLLNLKLA